MIGGGGGGGRGLLFSNRTYSDDFGNMELVFSRGK